MKYLLTFFVCTLFNSLFAQSWQWSVRGGGFSDGANLLPYESVVDMASDPNGNIYILAIIEASGIPTLGSTSLTTYGNRDVLIASYTCSGLFRWKKTIGGLSNDFPVALQTDLSGHVYVTGMNSTVNTHNIHFDIDSAQGTTNYKSLYLVQYDTSGVFKWLRQQAPDTVAAATNRSKFFSYDLNVSPSGDAYMLSYLSPGLLSGGGGNVITQTGNYILHYNVNGDLSDIIRLDMDGRPTFSTIRLARTRSGKFLVSGSLDIYSSGTNYLYMGGQQITHAMFIGAFSSQGQFLWKRENTSANNYYGGFYYRPIVDSSSNIYLGGGNVSPGDIFNGYTFLNTVGNNTVPFVAKLDSNGNNIWIKNGSTNAATFGNGVAVVNNKVYLIADYPGRMVWDSYQYNNPPNTDYDISLTTFDAQTGAVLKLDSLKSDFGVYDRSASITTDVRGNVYVGGFFGSQLNVNGTTLYNSGGSSDFFLAKYGSSNCGVLPLSLVSFTASVQHNNILCNWQTASEQNTSHFIVERSNNGTDFTSIATIKAAGNSNALVDYHYNDKNVALAAAKLYYRLKMIDKDGSYTYSNIVVVNLSSSSNLVSINPNPANTSTTISYNFLQGSASNRQLDVYDVTGKRIATYSLQQKGSVAIDMSSRAAGVYLVVLKQNGITVKTAKMVVSR